MQTIKHFLTGILLFLTSAATFAQNSGDAGPLHWEFNTGYGMLTISGNGAMPNYTSGTAPWYHLRESSESIGLVTVETGVTTIGNYAFYNCTSLRAVTIPNSVTTIGNSVFSACPFLTAITIPNPVTAIGNSAFSACTSLTEVTIHNSVAGIEDYAFLNCKSLATVTNHATTPQTINANVFNNVPLSSCRLYVPAASVALYKAADVWKDFGTIAAMYSGDTGALHWEFNTGNGTLTISGNGAMPNYSSFYISETAPWYHLREFIQSATVETGVTTIGDYAFYNCTFLRAATIPNSVKTIGYDAFKYCSSLTSITIPNSVKTIGNDAFSGCTSLTSVTIPNSVTAIGKFAFSGCKSLTSVTIPNSVKSIGDYAFIGCRSVTSVTIPNSVTTIGHFAFRGCTSLTAVTNHAETPQTISGSVFEEVDISARMLYVPAASVALYEAKDVWKDFGSILPIGSSGIADIPANSITLYPNPAKDVLNIKSGELSIEKVEIVNLSGKTVSMFNNPTNEINVSALSAGIYFLKMETDKGNVTEKFVKE